jgi:hypothetical protein
MEKERFPVNPLQRHLQRLLLQLMQLLQLMLLQQQRRAWWALGHPLGHLF